MPAAQLPKLIDSGIFSQDTHPANGLPYPSEDHQKSLNDFMNALNQVNTGGDPFVEKQLKAGFELAFLLAQQVANIPAVYLNFVRNDNRLNEELLYQEASKDDVTVQTAAEVVSKRLEFMVEEIQTVRDQLTALTSRVHYRESMNEPSIFGGIGEEPSMEWIHWHLHVYQTGVADAFIKGRRLMFDLRKEFPRSVAKAFCADMRAEIHFGDKLGSPALQVVSMRAVIWAKYAGEGKTWEEAHETILKAIREQDKKKLEAQAVEHPVK